MASPLDSAHPAVTELREQLDRHGIQLEGLAVDLAAAMTGVAAVTLGRATVENARRLSAALRRAPAA